MASLIRSNKLMFKLIAVVAGLFMYATGLQVAFAEHGDATLNAEVERGESIVGTTYFIKATISETSEKTVNIDAELESVSVPGPPPAPGNGSVNDDDGNSPNSPDLNCDIPIGETWCFLSYQGDNAGDDQICVWVDEDNENETADGDCDEEVSPSNALNSGSGDHCAPGPEDPDGEEDCTDVVRVNWSNDEGTTVDCDDASGSDRERETNGAGQSEAYTCRLRKAPGVEADGMIYGEVVGSVNDPDPDDNDSFDTPDYMCVSDGNGNCTITVTQSENEVGTTEICFWSPGTGSGEGSGGDLCSNGHEPVGEDQQPNLSDAGNDLADAVELTWSAAVTSGATTTGATGTSGTGPPGGTTTTSRTGTGGMTTPPGQSTSTTTTTTTQRQSVATNLSIRYKRGKFSGSVGSSKTRCQSGRRITLKKKKPGKDKKLGTTRSRRNSKWSIRKRARRGKYYAVAAKKVYTAQDGTVVTCKPDRSPTIRP